VKNVFFRLASLTVVKRVAHPTNGGLGKTPNFGREIAQVVETFMGRWFSKWEFFYTKMFLKYILLIPLPNTGVLLVFTLANFWFSPLQFPFFMFVYWFYIAFCQS
jgi:hypothetical protein